MISSGEPSQPYLWEVVKPGARGASLSKAWADLTGGLGQFDIYLPVRVSVNEITCASARIIGSTQEILIITIIINSYCAPSLTPYMQS